MINHQWRRQALVALLTAGALAFAGLATAAEGDGKTESQQLAADLLAKMSNYLAKLPGFRVQLVSSYDTVQDSGEKIEFNELREIILSRPNQMRIEQVMSDGAQDLVLFDGKDITIYDSDSGIYAQAPQPGSVDDAVVYFIRDLGMRLPLAAMLTTRLPDELSKRVKSIDYVEFTEIFGLGAHHVAARTSTIDFQVWIADGDRPLPLRIVMTYKLDPGQPQFRAQFVEWDEQSSVAADSFKFEPPADAQKIVFAVQAPPVGSAPAPSTAPTGNLP